MKTTISILYVVFLLFCLSCSDSYLEDLNTTDQLKDNEKISKNNDVKAMSSFLKKDSTNVNFSISEFDEDSGEEEPKKDRQQWKSAVLK